MTILEERPSAAPRPEQPSTPLDAPIPVTRRRVDRFLIGAGVILTAVLLFAGGLLTWGNTFAEDYVTDELTAQQITFPSEESLEAQGRDDLVPFAGEQVTTGAHAEAYASYIGGHLEETADGLTYAQVPERAAQAALAEAIENGAPEAEVAALEAEAAELSEQRETLFRGEMLRGTLLNAFAWSTMGRIAGIAATVAFVGAAVMAALSVAGVLHVRKVNRSAP